MTRLFCGEALCKAPVAFVEGASFPVRCASCGTVLYPKDVLERLPPNELEPKRGELMAERGGVRVAVVSRDVAPDGPRRSGPVDIDRMLEQVDLDPAATKARQARGRMVLLALVVVAVGLAVVFSLR